MIIQHQVPATNNSEAKKEEENCERIHRQFISDALDLLDCVRILALWKELQFSVRGQSSSLGGTKELN